MCVALSHRSKGRIRTLKKFDHPPTNVEGSTGTATLYVPNNTTHLSPMELDLRSLMLVTGLRGRLGMLAIRFRVHSVLPTPDPTRKLSGGERTKPVT